MMAPLPFKYVCPKCGHTRVVKIQSDCLSPEDFLMLDPTCPKCQIEMERKELGFFDKFFGR